jgi:hypothetical protein
MLLGGGPRRLEISRTRHHTPRLAQRQASLARRPLADATTTETLNKTQRLTTSKPAITDPLRMKMRAAQEQSPALLFRIIIPAGGMC